MDKIYDVFDGSEWIKVTEGWMNGVANLDRVKEAYEENNKLRVVYNNGNEVYYSNIYGTWGMPVHLRRK